MKTSISILTLTAILTATINGFAAAYPEPVRQCLRLCATDLQAALASSSVPKDITIAILPIANDAEDYALGLLKTAVTSAGLKCVEGKEDPFVAEVFKEIEWDERKDVMLDAETLAKFGKLQAPRLLMYGIVRDAVVTNAMTYAELEVHISAVETKRHLWSQVLARRFYETPNQEGLLKLDPNVRELIRGSFDKAVAELKATAKLKDTRTVAVIPLAGDIDGFVTSLAESMVAKTDLLPKQLATVTVGEARALLRDKPQEADAILYGAVRDLSRKFLNEYPHRIDYETSSAVQLMIQDAKTGNVLWSDIIEARGTDSTRFTWWEMTQRFGPYVLAHKWWIIVPIAVIMVLVASLAVLFMLLRMLRRAR